MTSRLSAGRTTWLCYGPFPNCRIHYPALGFKHCATLPGVGLRVAAGTLVTDGNPYFSGKRITYLYPG